LPPLRFGPPECFRTLKGFLRDSGYTEQAVCERLGLEAQTEILARPLTEPAPEIHDVKDLLVRLFLLGSCVETKLARELLPATVLEAIAGLGLLESDGPAICHASAVLYPIRELYIASDRWTNPDGSHFTPQADIVYPAITRNTYRFLGMLPSEPCGQFLDLCSGSGVAAIAAASGCARQTWAVDITERSTHFAEFNRLLNGADNVIVLQGDLFEPVRNLTFDRIVAHPPYLPANGTRWIFQDAGAEGEEITRGVVGGLARHLSPGGRFYCLSLGVDHRDEPLEARIRTWLGEHESEFDVLVAVIETHTPEQIASQPLVKGEITHAESTGRRAAFVKAGVESFIYGFLIIQRKRESGRAGFTVRRQVGPRTASPELEWAMRWESVAASPAVASFLLEERPVLSKNLELCVIHRVEEGALAPARFTLQTDYPFSMESLVHPWTVALAEACDGSRTGLELHDHCLQLGWISPDVPAKDFARFLCSLVSGGFLEVGGFKPPAGMVESAAKPVP